MTLLHTKGYAEVLESVKMRAQKKAAQMARMQVNVEFVTLLRKLPNIALNQVTYADEAVNGDSDRFTIEEAEELLAVFAEDFLHHYRYELDQIRSEKVAAEEKAEVEG